jgi:hypothetical protein
MCRAGILVALLAAAGCGRHLNPAYCADHHDDPDCAPAIDAPSDVLESTCERDDQCASNLCLPAGTCAPPEEILYVSPTGSGIECSATAKCKLETALSLATPTRNLVLLDAGMYSGAYSIDRTVTVIGRNAVIDGGAGNVPTLSITRGAVAELQFLRVSNSKLTGIACTDSALVGRRIEVSGNGMGIAGGCDVTLERSIIARNGDGAISLTKGVIDIHGNFIVNNGRANLSIPLVDLKSAVVGSLSWNTIAMNDTSNSKTAIACAAQTLVATGNLIADPQPAQVSGTCDFTASYRMVTTTANDLGWASPQTNDFHLTAASTQVIDKTTGCNGVIDFDGQMRPLGGSCDFGGDELAP